MGGVGVCGRGEEVWWKGWRCVEGVEVCGWGGGVSEGWRCMGGVMCGMGGGVRWGHHQGTGMD